MLREFKEFAMRGNVVDMAVGIVIGAAFGTIVKSLVNDIIMPPIGLILGGVDFSNIFLTLKGARYDSLAAAQAAGAVTVNAMNQLKRKQEAGAAEAPPPPRQEMLLEEIRDLLKKRR